MPVRIHHLQAKGQELVLARVRVSAQGPPVKTIRRRRM
jgi:hypothetical protein